MNNALKLFQGWKKFYPVKLTRLFCSEFDVKELTNYESQNHEKSLNKVQLLGRVGRDPVVVTTEGKFYVKFSFATYNVWKTNNGETKEKTEWHTIISHEPKLVNYISNYVKKGQRLYLSGRLTYTDSDNNGKEKYAFIRLNYVISLGS